LPLPSLHPDYDDNAPNLNAQNIIESKARQLSVKIDHHFTDNISINSVYLNQSTFEPDANYFPDALYAAPAFHLQRDVNVFVLNNTYISGPQTVATFRVGMNTFSDDNVLPYPFDMHTGTRNEPRLRERDPGSEVPVVDADRLCGHGPSGLSDTNYYSYGATARSRGSPARTA
jgi:hypothetical protein